MGWQIFWYAHLFALISFFLGRINQHWTSDVIYNSSFSLIVATHIHMFDISMHFTKFSLFWWAIAFYLTVIVSARLVLNAVLAPVFGLPLNPQAAAEAEKLLSLSLSKIESIWLKGNGRFLLGGFQPSIADLSLVCEILQLEVYRCDSMLCCCCCYCFLNWQHIPREILWRKVDGKSFFSLYTKTKRSQKKKRNKKYRRNNILQWWHNFFILVLLSQSFPFG